DLHPGFLSERTGRGPAARLEVDAARSASASQGSARPAGKRDGNEGLGARTPPGIPRGDHGRSSGRGGRGRAVYGRMYGWPGAPSVGVDELGPVTEKLRV